MEGESQRKGKRGSSLLPSPQHQPCRCPGLQPLASVGTSTPCCRPPPPPGAAQVGSLLSGPSAWPAGQLRWAPPFWKLPLCVGSALGGLCPFQFLRPHLPRGFFCSFSFQHTYTQFSAVNPSLWSSQHSVCFYDWTWTDTKVQNISPKVTQPESSMAVPTPRLSSELRYAALPAVGARISADH